MRAVRWDGLLFLLALYMLVGGVVGRFRTPWYLWPAHGMAVVFLVGLVVGAGIGIFSWLRRLHRKDLHT